jgi:hypothetical protein
MKEMILKIIRENDGIERRELFKRVEKYVSKTSFNTHLTRLINQKEINKMERTKYHEGVRKMIVKFFVSL